MKRSEMLKIIEDVALTSERNTFEAILNAIEEYMIPKGRPNPRHNGAMSDYAGIPSTLYEWEKEDE